MHINQRDRVAISTPSELGVLLRQLKLEGRFAGYRPSFRVEEFNQGRWWVLDRDVKVGLITRPEDFVELVNFDPLNPLRGTAFPEFYHAPTAPGDRITMAKWICAQETTSSANSLRFESDESGVTAIFEESWPNGRIAWTRLRFAVDPDWGYMIDVSAEMHSPCAEAAEFCNFLPEHVVDDRPEFLRYPFVLWKHPDGGIRRWNQNNIGARALGVMDIHDRRCIKTGGFIGFFGEKDRNPVIEIVDASPGTTAGTCPNMLDEHIQWLPVQPDQFARDAGERYISSARYHLFSAPGAVSVALATQAAMVDMVLDRIDMHLEREHAWCVGEYPRRPNEPKHLRYYALQMGKVCNFESKLDPSVSVRASVFACLDDANLPVSVVSDVGRSGTHSLRLRPSMGIATMSPSGTTIHLTAGRRYRLSAWVRTSLQSGDARLRVKEFLFSLKNCTARYESDPAAGVSDAWRQLSIEFTASPKAHGVQVILEANGVGDVWFDDVLLEAIE